MTPAGKTQQLVDSVVSSLALDSLKALKATGATMGALNQSELEILKTELAKVDLAAGPDVVKAKLGVVRGHYRTVLSDLYRGASDEDAAKITMFLGLQERPAWAGGSSSSNAAPRPAARLSPFSIPSPPQKNIGPGRRGRQSLGSRMPSSDFSSPQASRIGRNACSSPRVSNLTEAGRAPAGMN